MLAKRDEIVNCPVYQSDILIPKLGTFCDSYLVLLQYKNVWSKLLQGCSAVLSKSDKIEKCLVKVVF